MAVKLLLLVCSIVALLFVVAIAAERDVRSSHSEAPGVAQTPSADITDFYFFRSYESGREGYVTFILNIYPLQYPHGGPNYFSFSDDHFYEINIDNNGDGNQDLIFQFIYGNALGGAATYVVSDPDPNDCTPFTYNHTVHTGLMLPVGDLMVPVALKFLGPVTKANPFSNMNWFEYYQMQLIIGDRTSTNIQTLLNADTGNATFNKPFDYVGQKTMGNATAYEAYAESFIGNVNLPNCAAGSPTVGRIFVGQRAESFHINLGRIFDLVNFDPTDIPQCDANNDIGGFNIGSFIFEVPIGCITSTSTDVVGAWATVRLLDHGVQHVPGAQTSREGNPLVNELVIGLPSKDLWNSQQPLNDTVLFANYVTNPTLPVILDILFRPSGSTVSLAPSNYPRNDLIAAFLTGIPTINQPAGVVASDMIRLNVSIAPTAAANQNSLGVIGGDAAGFPNGRRPGDDVVDIGLRVLMGVLCTLPLGYCNSSQAPAGTVAFTDGAPVNAGYFYSAFPYLTTPNPGSVTNNNPCSSGSTTTGFTTVTTTGSTSAGTTGTPSPTHCNAAAGLNMMLALLSAVVMSAVLLLC